MCVQHVCVHASVYVRVRVCVCVCVCVGIEEEMACAVMTETAIFQQSSAVACQKLDLPLGAAIVVVHLVIKPLAWKAHHMKMVNQTEREDERMSQASRQPAWQR